jgi:hypothetical protein
MNECDIGGVKNYVQLRCIVLVVGLGACSLVGLSELNKSTIKKSIRNPGEYTRTWIQTGPVMWKGQEGAATAELCKVRQGLRRTSSSNLVVVLRQLSLLR